MQFVPNTTTFLIKLIYDYVKDNKYNEADNIIYLLFLYKKDINKATTDEDNILIDYNGTMINNLIWDVLLESCVNKNYKVVKYILDIGCKYDFNMSDIDNIFDSASEHGSYHSLYYLIKCTIRTNKYKIIENMETAYIMANIYYINEYWSTDEDKKNYEKIFNYHNNLGINDSCINRLDVANLSEINRIHRFIL